MGEQLSDDEQDAIVLEIAAEGRVQPGDAEFDRLYAQLDADRQGEVDQSYEDFAANAVGDPHWNADD